MRAVRRRVPAPLAVFAEQLFPAHRHGRRTQAQRRARLPLQQVAREDVVPWALADLAHLRRRRRLRPRRLPAACVLGQLALVLGRFFLRARELVLEPLELALQFVLRWRMRNGKGDEEEERRRTSR